PGASHALLQAVAKNKHVKSEEAVAVAALSLIPNHLVGDQGWSAVRTAVNRAIKTSTRPPRSRFVQTAPARAAAPYGPNHAEVAAFIKGAAELSPIKWLRVLDRRKLVASVTREGSAEPAGVVRSILATLEGTRDLDTYTRCRAFAAVERAGFAIESHGKVN